MALCGCVRKEGFLEVGDWMCHFWGLPGGRGVYKKVLIVLAVCWEGIQILSVLQISPL